MFVEHSLICQLSIFPACSVNFGVALQETEAAGMPDLTRPLSEGGAAVSLLMFAALLGNYELVRLLLQAGAVLV